MFSYQTIVFYLQVLLPRYLDLGATKASGSYISLSAGSVLLVILFGCCVAKNTHKQLKLMK